MEFYTRFAAHFAAAWGAALVFCAWRAIRRPLPPTDRFVHRFGILAPTVYCSFRTACAILRAMGEKGRADDVAALLAMIALPMAVATAIVMTRKPARAGRSGPPSGGLLPQPPR